MNNLNNNINDQIKMEVSEFKFNDVKNERKPFGFHIATISVVLIKRVWKRRTKISKYVLNKSYKKTEDKRGFKRIEGYVEHTEHNKGKTPDPKKFTKHIKGYTINPEEFTGDRKWCWDKFEHHIGVPRRKDTPPSTALALIRLKSYQRFIPEARNLAKPKKNDFVFLTMDKPRSDCLRPDRKCFGEIINKRAKIPKNGCIRIPKLFSKRMTANVFIKTFINATSASAEEKKEMHYNVILRKELRLSSNHVIEKLPDIELGPSPEEIKKREELEKEKLKKEELEKLKKEELEKLKKEELKKEELKKEELKKEELKKEELKAALDVSAEKKKELPDDQAYDIVHCTVSTQTEYTSDGKLKMDDFSHLVYSNNQETFLNDIRGKKLQISHYTHVYPKQPDCFLHRPAVAKNMEKLLNFKEIKDRLYNLISSIYVIKDPGPPVRNNATQIPLIQRFQSRIRKFCAPNCCGDEDYKNLKRVPWQFKIQEAIFEEMRRYELQEQKDDACPCCEYFADSAIDKNELLEKLRDVLTLPGDIQELGESITIAKKITREIVANAFDDFCEKKKNEEKAKLLSSFKNAGKASDEIMIVETDNNRKTVKYEFLIPKNSSNSKTVAQKMSESVARWLKKIAKRNSSDTDFEKEKDEIEINPKQNTFGDKGKVELSKDLPNNNEMNHRSSFKNSKNRAAQRVSFDTKNTSKDKIVHQVNTSYKKASSVISSLFKWLFAPPTLLSQTIKTSLVKSKDKLSKDMLSKDILSKDILSKDILSKYILSTATNLNRVEKSEQEVFSIRYTTSAISVSKSNSFEADK